ncbi:MAG TPA: YidB family protein [Reyranella sp.]|nr:YidB family protein [Reyranella sp.]
MGLFDVLTGMRNGPRGGDGGGRSSGMSPIILAALGLLAYKAVKSFNTAPQPAQHPQGGSQPGAPAAGGGLGGLVQSLGLGGGGGAAAGSGGLGGILSGGLGDLVKQFQNAGKGEMADSWVGTGQNKTIPPADLAEVLTPEQIDFLTAKTGLSREELLAGLSQQLPEVVDQLTPQGRLPSPQELDRT